MSNTNRKTLALLVMVLPFLLVGLWFRKEIIDFISHHPPGDIGDLGVVVNDLAPDLTTSEHPDLTVFDQAHPQEDLSQSNIESDETEATILRMLQATSSSKICEGARMAKKHPSNSVIRYMLPKLKSQNESIFDCIRNSLEQLPAGPILGDMWKHGKKREALEYAVYLSHVENMKLYIPSAHSEEPALRRLAAVGLKQQRFAKQDALRLLKELAQDNDKLIRQRAIDSMDILDHKTAYIYLKDKLSSEVDPDIKILIQDILQKGNK